MNDWPFHQYVFFELSSDFRRQSESKQLALKQVMAGWLSSQTPAQISTFATLGFAPDSTFLLWLHAHKPEDLQDTVRDLFRTEMGQYLTVTSSLFGLARHSQYSRGEQKADQTIGASERLPYLIIYPFTKTVEWHLLPFDERKRMMRDHIQVGIKHTSIRQCLLYAYGVDNHEFIVSYETPTLQAFQDLVMELRGTEGRRYTASDTPIYTCIYKPAHELVAWL
jgi:chlorite dismutase